MRQDSKFKRSKAEILNDYRTALISYGAVKTEDIDGLTDEFLEKLLIEKLYEVEEVDGQQVSSLDAFYHWCNFVIKRDLDTGKEVWNPFVRQMFLNFERNKYVAIQSARGSGKSFVLYGLFLPFKHFLWERYQSLVMCNIPRMGKRNLKIFKDIVENNELLFSKVTQSSTEDWATQGILRFNDGTMEIISLGTTPRSAHLNFAGVDDPLRDDNKYSNEQVENMVLGVLMPTLTRKQGRMVVLGTPQNHQDLFHRIMADEKGILLRVGEISKKGFASFIYPAFKNMETKELTFPGIYSVKELETVREAMGEDKFMREYQLECISEDTKLFPTELIEKSCDPKEVTLEMGEEGKHYVISADIAVSGEASADFSAFIVLEIEEGAHKIGAETTNIITKKIIRYAKHVKGMPIHEQINHLEFLSKQFNNSPVVVEVNNVGVALIQELQARSVDVTSFRTDKFVKEGAIRFLINEMKLGRLIIPEEEQDISELKKELSKFGIRRTAKGTERMESIGLHDDLVLSLAIGNSMAKDLSSGCSFAVCQD